MQQNRHRRKGRRAFRPSYRAAEIRRSGFSRNRVQTHSGLKALLRTSLCSRHKVVLTVTALLHQQGGAEAQKGHIADNIGHRGQYDPAS